VDIYFFLFKHLPAHSEDHAGLAVQYVWFFGGPGRSGRLEPSSTDGGRKVDIALRLNVLAVCAAIVFVAAILFGAF
jgi:hypothetical protein